MKFLLYDSFEKTEDWGEDIMVVFFNFLTDNRPGNIFKSANMAVNILTIFGKVVFLTLFDNLSQPGRDYWISGLGRKCPKHRPGNIFESADLAVNVLITFEKFVILALFDNNK